MSQNVPGNREIAVELLGTCNTVSATAEKCGVDRRTIHRWLQESDFSAQVTLRRKEFVDEQLTRLRGLVPNAIDTLKVVMVDAAHPAAAASAALRVLRAAGLMREDPPPAREFSCETIVFGTLLVEEGKILALPPPELTEQAAATPDNADPQPRPDSADHRPPASASP